MLKKIVLPFIISAILVIATFLSFNSLETFFVNLLTNASHHKATFSGVSFLVLASDILLPVPSSIVMYTNGYVLGLLGGSLISLLALAAGSVVGYYLGMFTSIGVKAKGNERADAILSKYGMLSILISRGIPIISESICIVCGYNRMPFKTYFILSIIGYIPLCLLYAFCGSIGFSEDIFLISFGSSIVIAIAFWFFGRRILGKNTLSAELK